MDWFSPGKNPGKAMGQAGADGQRLRRRWVRGDPGPRRRAGHYPGHWHGFSSIHRRCTLPGPRIGASSVAQENLRAISGQARAREVWCEALEQISQACDRADGCDLQLGHPVYRGWQRQESDTQARYRHQDHLQRRGFARRHGSVERSAITRLRRLHLFEFLDQPWCPQAVRHGATDFLEAITSRGDIYRPIQAEIFRAIDDCGAERVIDLCSGGGGPWLSPAWRSALAEHAPLTVAVTDKVPSSALPERLVAGVSCVNFPVDAAQVPEALRGFRTIFSSFH